MGTEFIGRTDANVAAEPDPATGAAIYGPLAGGNSGWLEFGRTSVAMLMWAVSMAQIAGGRRKAAALSLRACAPRCHSWE
jgi:hypothetical protein